MNILPELQMLYTNYLDKAKALHADDNKYASLLKWLFGMSHNPGDKELNPGFYDAVSSCLKKFQSEPYTPEEVSDIVSYMLQASVANADNPIAGLTLVAVHGLLPLAPMLPAEKAAELVDRYQKQYPYRSRFPVQEELLKALKARE